MKPIVVSVLFFLTVAMSAQAEDALSVTPEQTWDAVQEQGDHLLFIDVRDPVEIMFIGFTDAVDRNIPFQLVDRTRWNDEKGVFAMDINEDFVAQVDADTQFRCVQQVGDGFFRHGVFPSLIRLGLLFGGPAASPDGPGRCAIRRGKSTLGD